MRGLIKFNLDREIRDLEKRLPTSSPSSTISERWDAIEKAEEEALAKASLTKEEQEELQQQQQEQELMDHLGEYHVVPILKWKISVGLEQDCYSEEWALTHGFNREYNSVDRDYFVNYGEDLEHKTVEEIEYFRLMREHYKRIGYDPKKDPQRKF